MQFHFSPRLLREIRLRNELSQRRLGVLVGSARETIGVWECGRKTPGADSICRLASALNCEPGDFFEPGRARTVTKTIKRRVPA